MLQAIGLTKDYGDLRALDTLDLTVEAGEIFCLLGANGAGKTTTLNLFLNFIQPCAGEARVDGIEVAKQPTDAKKALAYLPEQVMLYPKLTGFENLTYFLELSGLRLPESERNALFDQVGLDQAASRRRLETYSKGMRQKVALAIALGKKAKALLLDEPTSGLDPRASKTFSDLMTNLRDQGMALLMATHDLFRAREMSDRIGVMRSGKLVGCYQTADLTTAELESLYLQHMSEA
ncbi:ABC transporter ATP-binding protein [Acanthopleuribacter pedis]|uniref:ABC transporter ATP-binding protein n=1 Tax=Acanthopleuribacter pedis TaxID=442870 RepID=A0A8J7U3K8_9BACT|nr:ABC transporter ATP-binding protein [Acanthopleuribacter pedis]MBO1319727.1 ABC transporter ATP-binding protein [Acanthopleuribacter pedis]